MVEITYQMVLSTLQTIALVVGIAYYLFIIRNSQRTRELALKAQELTLKAQEQALETRQAQLFMNIYNQSFANREWLNAYNKVMTTHWDDYDDFLKIGDWTNPENSDKEYLEAQGYVSTFYEGLGVFVKEGLVDIRLIALTMTHWTKNYWEKIAPTIYQLRKDMNYPRLLSEFEYLYDELMKYLEEHPELKT